MLLKPAKIARVLTILSVIGLFPALVPAQTNDPLVGTWNFKVTATAGARPTVSTWYDRLQPRRYGS